MSIGGVFVWVEGLNLRLFAYHHTDVAALISLALTEFLYSWNYEHRWHSLDCKTIEGNAKSKASRD